METRVCSNTSVPTDTSGHGNMCVHSNMCVHRHRCAQEHVWVQKWVATGTGEHKTVCTQTHTCRSLCVPRHGCANVRVPRHGGANVRVPRQAVGVCTSTQSVHADPTDQQVPASPPSQHRLWRGWEGVWGWCVQRDLGTSPLPSVILQDFHTASAADFSGREHFDGLVVVLFFTRGLICVCTILILDGMIKTF